MKQNNNLENQFRKKLNERTIQPSDKAWDRLDAMLSVAEKKKTKKGWFWIAASLVVFATIGSLFFKTNKNEIIPTENFVVEKTHDQKIIIDPIHEIWNDEENFAVSEKELKKKPIPQNNFQVRKETDVLNNTIHNNFKNENTEMVTTGIDIKIESHTAPESNTYITAQNLLDSIIDEKHIAEQNNKPAVSIDHKSLLYQAEMEVEQQYRKNAIDRFLQKSYDNVRVATLNKF